MAVAAYCMREAPENGLKIHIGDDGLPKICDVVCVQMQDCEICPEWKGSTFCIPEQ